MYRLGNVYFFYIRYSFFIVISLFSFFCLADNDSPDEKRIDKEAIIFIFATTYYSDVVCCKKGMCKVDSATFSELFAPKVKWEKNTRTICIHDKGCT